VVVLRVWEGLPYAQIAEVLETTEATVRSHTPQANAVDMGREGSHTPQPNGIAVRFSLPPRKSA
jgi:hypothetical protein